MISRVILSNFRKHRSSIINLESDLTVLIGENDTGKSSFIHAIQTVLNGSVVKLTDFYDRNKDLVIDLEMSDALYGVTARINNDLVEHERYVKYYARDVVAIRNSIDEKTDEEVRELCRNFGIRTTSAMKPSTLKEKLIEKLNDKTNYKGKYFIASSTKEIGIHVYSLTGVEFDSIEKFIHETFFKVKQREIWNSPINEMTLHEFIQDRLDFYKSEAEREVNSSGIIDVVKQYITGIENIEIYPEFDRRDINVSLSVKLLTATGENQSVHSFGDGTKRRLTIALLEHKAKTGDTGSLYLFDEPDTHLHVRAQNDLLNAFDSIAKSGNQVIVTTHSPFIMNAVNVRQIRLLTKHENVVSIKGNIEDEDGRDNSLNAIGIENVYLFFSKKFLIIEGETEEAFIPLAYQSIHDRPISRDFIKVINTKGITNVPKFAEIMLKFTKPEDVYILTDNDAKPKTRELIDSLRLQNIYTVGRKELEDAFSSEIVYLAWYQYVTDRGIDIGPNWTSEALSNLFFDARKIDEGVSKHLRQLNQGCSVSLEKETLGEALGLYCKEQHLPNEIITLLRVLKSES